ncbi:kinase-like domain-containing protein [Xylaria cf. heliscus]|nr:kinase-like domain-containing protein [Xylaria cf. heliscus]
METYLSTKRVGPSRPHSRSSASEASEQALIRFFRDKCQKNFQDEIFLPQSKLQNILSEDLVRMHLCKQLVCDDDELNSLVTKISGDESPNRCIKIFAILISMGKSRYIHHFMKKGLCDKKLPLNYDTFNTLLGDFCGSDTSDWFCHNMQWRIDVPVFNFTLNEVQKRQYPASTIFPFLEKKQKSEGAHGIVWEVFIHPDHVQGTSSGDNRFAVKEFRQHHRHLWQDELEVLERFSWERKGHDHLINVLFAYEHKNNGYFLVFPLAEGNLANYWENTSSSNKDTYWLIEQCFGIASALSKIHRHGSMPEKSHGRHGDIKPENILWFKGSGQSNHSHARLVVADFTLTRFHKPDTVNNTIVGQRGFSRTYRAPEADLPSQSAPSQSYDIWSLGCVYLEFISWHLLGVGSLGRKGASVGDRGHSRRASFHFTDDRGQLRETFSTARIHEDNQSYNAAREDKFFKVPSKSDGSAVVKKSVRQWIDLLRSSNRCSEALHDFLNLVQHRMLLANPRDRDSMDQIRTELHRILQKSSNDSYCLQGRPRSGQHDDASPLEQSGNEPQGNTNIDPPPRSFSDHMSTLSEDIAELVNLVSGSSFRTELEDTQNRPEYTIDTVPSEPYVTGRATLASLKVNKWVRWALQGLWRRLHRVARRPKNPF